MVFFDKTGTVTMKEASIGMCAVGTRSNHLN